MNKLAKEAWLKKKCKRFTPLPRYLKLFEGDYVRVAWKEHGECIGRIAYKGDPEDEVGINRFVTIYFEIDDSFWDLNMWGSEGKMVHPIDLPPIEEQFGIPEDPTHKFEENKGEDDEEGEDGEETESDEEEKEKEGEDGEEGEDDDTTASAPAPAAPPRKRKKRKSLYTWKKKRRVATQ